MDFEEILFLFNSWWEEPYPAPGIKREGYLSKLYKLSNSSDIVIITGLRRVGKTTLMQQLIAKILDEQITKPENILYVSLEHPALDNVSLLDIVETTRKIHGLKRKERLFLFFDEVQYKEDFERELKVLHDIENVKIYAGGSNSLVIRDKKAYLTGRHIVVKVEPLTFEEYLHFNNLTIKKTEAYLYERYVEDYLREGGMPEYVLSKNREKLLQLVKDILYKDIVTRYNVRNVKKLEELFVLLCERVGKRLTVNKLRKVLGIKNETITNYLSYLEETYLIYLVPKCSKSLNEQIRAPKKVYVADTGIRTMFVGYKDKGALFENLVFLKLKNSNPCYGILNGKEIDFVVGKNCAVEVKYKREVDDKQLSYFYNSEYKKKILIKNIKDLRKLE
ncbi:MAG: ATP-binding protein [Candidatus Heimdallarchaeaceae archaeon]